MTGVAAEAKGIVVSMNLNLLAVNVGNTRTQFAAVINGEVGSDQQIAHADNAGLGDAIEPMLAAVAEAEGGEPIALLSSVNDDAAKAAIEALTVLDCATARVEDHLPVPIGRQLDPETIVGTDRLLNAAAAFDETKQACIVVDAGSAVTVDFIDGEGTFHGGAILPGVRMQLNALHAYTAQLPELTFARPVEAIGHSTAQAMLTGAFHGTRGAVRELIEAFAVQYGGYPKVIATGGDAEALFDGYELIESIVPNLTLRGLAVTRRVQLEQEAT